MLHKLNVVAHKYAKEFIPKRYKEIAQDIKLVDDAGHGYDRFGAHKDWVAFSIALNSFLYEKYFRTQSFGVENIPLDGPVILTPNHGGTLPLDGMMLHQDVIRKTGRLPRPIADFFVPKMPLVSMVYSRVGVVSGARGNVNHLLKNGEALVIFPEGLPGISKTYKDRYQLRHWRPGHIELAKKHKAAIVPVAIVGPDDQMPLLAKIESFKTLGAPYLPIPLTPFPLPVKYRIFYGEPVYPHLELGAVSSHFDSVEGLAKFLKAKVQGMIDKGLHERQGVFK